MSSDDKQKTESGLFREGHYKNVNGFIVVAENSTNQVMVGSPGTVKIIEVLPKGFVLEMPVKSVVSGQYLVLRVFPIGKMKLLRTNEQARMHRPLLTVTGKLSSVEVKESETKQLAQFEIGQMDPKEWTNFIRELEDNQTKVNTQLRKMKS